MKIIKDFVPEFYQNSIYETLLNDEIDWKFLKNASEGINIKNINNLNYEIDQSGFYHLAYFDNKICSNIFYLVRPFINILSENYGEKISSLLRIRLGLSLMSNENGYRYPHTDFDFPHKTLLYYVNTSDGDTIFYNEKFGLNHNNNFSVMKTYTPEMGTAILFDGLRYHSSSKPIVSNHRFTININYI